jgi:paraquat-inducible protein B
VTEPPDEAELDALPTSDVESLKSLIIGGIAFATPEGPDSRPAKDGSLFVLHDTPQKEWLYWMPKISIPPAES